MGWVMGLLCVVTQNLMALAIFKVSSPLRLKQKSFCENSMDGSKPRFCEKKAPASTTDMHMYHSKRVQPHSRTHTRTHTLHCMEP